jgi:hypothetical protein
MHRSLSAIQSQTTTSMTSANAMLRVPTHNLGSNAVARAAPDNTLSPISTPAQEQKTGFHSALNVNNMQICISTALFRQCLLHHAGVFHWEEQGDGRHWYPRSIRAVDVSRTPLKRHMVIADFLSLDIDQFRIAICA